MEKRRMSKRKMIPILILLVILVVIIGGSYAWLVIELSGEQSNILRAGTLSLILDDKATEGISIDDAVPMTEQTGKKQGEYTFQLKNNGNISANYRITLEDEGTETANERIPDSAIRYELVKNGKSQTQETTGTMKFIPGDYIATFDQEKHQFTTVVNSKGETVPGLGDALNNKLNQTITTNNATFEEATTVFKEFFGTNYEYEITAPKESTILKSREIDLGTINKNDVNNYTLKLWIDENADNSIMGKIFFAKLKVYAEQISNTNNRSVLCKRATTLHTEICKYPGESGLCGADGYSGTDSVSYGQIGTAGTLASGDAFDCDINADGNYDSDTERFYYVSDYYNTTTNSFDSNTAVLIYYSNVSAGVPNDSTGFAYDESESNWLGPVTAIKQLPTTSQWKTTLKNSKRAILSENNSNFTTGTTSTNGGVLPSEFSYEGYAARLLTAQELNKACDITIGTETKGELSTNCKYMLEGTTYAKTSYNYGWWLETPREANPYDVWLVYGWRNVRANVAQHSSYYGVRPVIEISKKNIIE